MFPTMLVAGAVCLCVSMLHETSSNMIKQLIKSTPTRGNTHLGEQSCSCCTKQIPILSNKWSSPHPQMAMHTRKQSCSRWNLSCTRRQMTCLPSCRHFNMSRHVATCRRHVARHLATCQNVSLTNMLTYVSPTSRHVADIVAICRDIPPTCRDMSAICRKCDTNMSWSN